MDIHAQVLEGMPDRDPMDFVAVQAGGVAKGRWGEEEEGAGEMEEEEEEEEEEGDASMEVRRREDYMRLQYITDQIPDPRLMI